MNISSNIFLIKLFDNLNKIIKNTNIKKDNIKIKKIKDKPSKYLVESDFTSKNIEDYIFKNLKYSYKFIYDKITIIYFINKSNIITIPKIIMKMFFITVIIKKLFKRTQKQKIIFFDTNKKKTLPNEFKILDSDNVNSALTFVIGDQMYLNGDIILYRREEILKVLIHELIHSNCIDNELIYSIKSDEFSNLFCSNYKVLLNESFTETFACIINMMIVYIIDVKHIKNENQIKILEKMFLKECIYSNYICSKIKTFYKIKKITNIIKNNKCIEQFPQQTNVFSYYFIKNIILNNINLFSNLMNKYTINYKINNEEFIKEFINLIINNINNLDKRLKIIKDKNKSLKMSFYELKI